MEHPYFVHVYFCKTLHGCFIIVSFFVYITVLILQVYHIFLQYPDYFSCKYPQGQI
jgi:hypothetical protein